MLKKLQIPDSKNLQFVETLCNTSSPYCHSDDMDEIFIYAMKENVKWHAERSKFYLDLLEKERFDYSKINSIADLPSIPYIFANFFKKYEVLSIDRSDVFLHLTSSGTTGQKSQVFFDTWSIQSAQRMVDWIWDYNKWIDEDKPCNYLLYTYQPEEGSKLGTAYTDNFLCKYAPINEVVYALKCLGEGKHKFDIFGCIDALKRFEAEKLPVRIFGFPAFLYFTLRHIEKLRLKPFKLHPESLIFLGGGWKGYQNEAISKREFYRLANHFLGIPDHRLRDGFGSVEHCIPYIECKNHRFHVPTWSRVLIRDVRSLKVKEYGSVGYLNLISPYITSIPANCVLMGDLAALYPADSCSCELETPYFEIKGRAGLTKNRSCAVAAAELLKEF